MKKLTFISVLIVVFGTCFSVSAFADFYVIPVQKKGCYATSTIVPKTGQTNCYYDDGDTTGTCSCGNTGCTEGQDGDLQMGHAQAAATPPSMSFPYTVPNWTGERFTDNNDGTVTDNLTSLVWLKDANSAGESMSWASALSYCNNLAAGGGLTDGSSAGDWRLPNVNELHSLDDISQSIPCLPSGHPFTNVQLNYYWSSTTHASLTDIAWNMDMYDGGVYNYYGKASNYYVWPVRSGN